MRRLGQVALRMDVHRVEWLKRDWCKPSAVSATLMISGKVLAAQGYKGQNTMRLVSSIKRCAGASHGAVRDLKAQPRYVYLVLEVPHVVFDALQLFSARQELKTAVTDNRSVGDNNLVKAVATTLCRA